MGKDEEENINEEEEVSFPTYQIRINYIHIAEAFPS